ncbi:MAG: substrate-binding domain-containing protein [Candidatus Nanopelagicaceae bacterium]
MQLSKRARFLAISLGLVLSATVAPAHAVDLQGSGASFVIPVVDACKVGFAKNSNHTITYGAGGSGRGKSNSDANIGDFWFSDSAHTGSTRRDSIVHAPVVAAPVVVMHNLPARTQLYLSPATVAGIFSGEITKWNDPKIVADNNRSVTEVVYRKDIDGNVKKDKNGNNVILRTRTKNIRYTLPNKEITVFYRSDNSGTTNNFTRWMNNTAKDVWTKSANDAFTTSFPGDLNASGIRGRLVGANGSQGVALAASRTKYSITYAESNFATTYGLKTTAIGNASGNFTLPTGPAVSAFLAESTADPKSGFFTFDYATKEPGAYTLGIVSYMLIDTEPKDKARGRAVKEWAEYLMSADCTSGDAGGRGFITLSGKLLEIAKAQVNKMKL